MREKKTRPTGRGKQEKMSLASDDGKKRKQLWYSSCTLFAAGRIPYDPDTISFGSRATVVQALLE